jgi:hypothetical protein
VKTARAKHDGGLAVDHGEGAMALAPREARGQVPDGSLNTTRANARPLERFPDWGHRKRGVRRSRGTARSHRRVGVERSDGAIVVVEPSRLTQADVRAIAQRFAARLLAEAEQSGTLGRVGSAPARLEPAGGVTEEG